MKKLLFAFALLFLCNSLTLPQASGHRFTQIRPLLDNLGDLHIFYRLHYSEFFYPEEWTYNSIYHKDLSSNTDSLLIKSWHWSSPSFWTYDDVAGYTFIQNDPHKFIYIREGGYLFTRWYDINRFDGNTSYYHNPVGVSRIRINPLETDFLYAFNSALYISNNQGWDWELSSNSYSKITHDPFRIGTYYFSFNSQLYKTIDDWNTIMLSDSNNIWSSRLYFDLDSLHIYYETYGGGLDGIIRRSFNNGEPGSWETIYIGPLSQKICVHDTISGTIYLTEGMDLKRSTDFGNSFETYISLDEIIIDLYYQTVKGNVYVATENKLIEIKNNAIVILKELNITSAATEDLYSIDYSLTQNYPNPFNPTTIIKYQVPHLSFVTIKVYDVLGNEIATLVNEEKPIGNYEVEWNASDLPSGIYFYQLQAGNFVETKKMILLK